MFSYEKLYAILKNKILDFKQIAKRMNVHPKDNREFSKYINSLMKQNKLFSTFDRRYFIPEKLIQAEGSIRINKKGFGFIDLDKEHSVFVPKNNTLFSMDKDSVKFSYFRNLEKADLFQGFVNEIVKRKKESFVARVGVVKGEYVIYPLDSSVAGNFKILGDIEIPDNSLVKFKIISYGKVMKLEFIKILGQEADAFMDILSTIEDSGVPFEFDYSVLHKAKQIPVKVLNDELEGRRDLRKDLIVTIDGDDTKDFDDAISIEKLPNGNFSLSVHIADVTHYVKEDDDIDKEAKNRGTSIYLVDRVIPMLPFELSNGICSLNPNVDRLAITCQMEIDASGKNVKYDIFPSVINSKKRLTYKEVNNFYEDNSLITEQDLAKTLNNSLKLSEIIRTFKNKEGYIDFEIEESKIIVDENGKTIDIVPRERGISEKMIEDFMVRANETVAFHATKKEVPFIYRTHDKPDFEKVTNLNNVTKLLNIDVQLPVHLVPSEFARSIEEIKNTRFDGFMKMMLLRTMSKAEYSSNNIGHFGLASETYTHFTSPIRRYPDLMVHRMLRTYFFESKKNAKKHFAEILPSIAEYSSFTEQRAVELERKIDDIKKAEFYQSKVGELLEGVVVSTNKFGFFVEFSNKVNGLVHSSTISDAGYELEKDGYSFTNGSNRITIGDKVNVYVVNAVKSEGKIDLVLEEFYEKWKATKGKS